MLNYFGLGDSSLDQASIGEIVDFIGPELAKDYVAGKAN
jgi:hypothetical protein